MSGLSRREQELVRGLLRGDDTRALAREVGGDAIGVRRELESLLIRIAGGEASVTR